MADDPLAALSNVGQKVLALPTDVLNVGAKRMTEDMGMLTARVQDLGTALVPPAGGLALPQLPGMPGAAGVTEAAPSAATSTRSERVQGVKTARKMSYLKV